MGGEKLIFDECGFINLGNEGVLALIGDSTNADVPGYSGSESEVREELQQVFSRYINRIVVTCFSSNIARIVNIVHAAKKNNRKIALIGRSMKKNIEAAIKSGLIDDNNVFISEEEASLIPKENLVIICTGSQGEKRSALYVGVIYDRMHTRDINFYGGLVNRMPIYATVFMIFMLGSVGLPGTSGFVGEFLVIVGAFKYSSIVVIGAASGIVLVKFYTLTIFIYFKLVV